MKKAAHKNIINNLPYERDFLAGLTTARLLAFMPSERKKTVSLSIFVCPATFTVFVLVKIVVISRGFPAIVSCSTIVRVEPSAKMVSCR